MTIEAGRWYRRRSDGLVVRAVWNYRGLWDCVDAEGWTMVVAAADLEPWVPRQVERVEVHSDCYGADELCLRWASPRGAEVYPAALFEPCAPPADATAPPAIEALPPPSPEHLAAWAALGALSAPTPPRRDDGTRCHRCGGPAYTGLGTGGPPECLAPRCEPRSELEPTVRERWLTRTEGVFAIPVPGSECIYVAEGHGWTAQHPIRDEAVARWKEIVRRKR